MIKNKKKFLAICLIIISLLFVTFYSIRQQYWPARNNKNVESSNDEENDNQDAKDDQNNDGQNINESDNQLNSNGESKDNNKEINYDNISKDFSSSLNNDNYNSNEHILNSLDKRTKVNKSENVLLNQETVNYITKNLNSKYVKVDKDSEMTLVNALPVKQTIADGSQMNGEKTVDEVFNSQANGKNIVYTVLDSVVALYDYGENNNYYVAYIDTMHNADNINTPNAIFALNDDSGSTLDNCYYDTKTGLAYIPKSDYYDENGKIQLYKVQAQVLQVIKDKSVIYADTNVTSSTQTNNRKATIGNTDVGIFRFTTKIQTEKDLDENELLVSVNGIPLDNDKYNYNSKTGLITFEKSASTFQSVDVRINKKSIITQIKDKFGPITAKAGLTGGWDMGSQGTLYNFNTNNYMGQLWSPNLYVGYEEHAKWNDSQSYTFGNQAVANLIHDGDSWGSTVRSQYGNMWKQTTQMNIYADYYFDNSCQYLNTGGNTYRVWLECGHITNPTYDGNHKPNKTMEIQTRILEINRDGPAPYVIMGFLTPTVWTQAGVSIVKFNFYNSQLDFTPAWIPDGVYALTFLNDDSWNIDVNGDPPNYKDKSYVQLYQGITDYFHVVRAADGQSYVLRAENGSGGQQYISASDKSCDKSTPLETLGAYGEFRQYWYLCDKNNGYYTLRNKANPGQALDNKNGNCTNGNRLQLWEDNGNGAQKIRFRYNVDYDANGGSGAPGTTAHHIACYESLASTIPIKAGYNFTGWNTKADGTGDSYSPGQLVRNINDPNNFTRTLYAQWSVSKTYRVTYNANGGIGLMSADTATYGQQFKTKKCSFIRDGYAFAGWNESADGSGTPWRLTSYGVYESGKAGWTWNYNYSITLYAQWVKIADIPNGTYAITYDNDNYSLTSIKNNSLLNYNPPMNLISYNDILDKWQVIKQSDKSYILNLSNASKNIFMDVENSKKDNGTNVIANTGYYHSNQKWYFSDTSKDGVFSLRPIVNPDAALNIKLTNGNFTNGGKATIWTYSSTAKENHFKLRYEITYDVNGGSTPVANTVHHINISEKLSSVIPTRAGYQFMGWNTKADGSGTHYDAGESVMNINSTNYVTTLYAEWSNAKYYVNYNSNKPADATNNISGSMSKDTFTRNISYKLKSNIYSLKGWEFKGWNTKPDGSGTSYNDKAYVKNLASSGTTLTLYAQWQKKMYQIHYNGNATTSGSIDDETKYYDTYYYMRDNSNGFYKKGYTFDGWDTVPNGGTHYKVGDKFINIGEPDTTITLYASWKANKYTNTLHYDANGGTGAPDDQISTVTYPDTRKYFTVSSTKPTREGYTFLGWYTAKNGGTKYESGKNFTVGSNNYDGDQSATLYAHWSIKSYTVDLNGYLDGKTNESISPMGTADIYINGTQVADDVSDFNKKYNYGSTYEIKDIKAKTGYSYNGVYSGSLKGTVNGDISVYLNFTSNTYTNTLHYDANGGDGAPEDQTSTVTYPNTSNVFTVSSTQPTRTGYTFLGWYTAKSGETKYNAGTSFTVGSNNYAGNQSATLYAQWQRNQYTVTTYYYYSYLNTTWKQFDSKTEKIYYGDKCTPTNVTSPTGYSPGNNFSYYDSSGKYIGSGTVGKDSFTVTGDTIVHVHYYPNNYDLVVDPNGGTWNGSTSPQTFTQIFLSTKSIGVPSRTGYLFTDWTLSGYGTLSTLTTADPVFKNSMGGISTYNNTGNGNVILSKINKPSDISTDSPYVIQIQVKGTASPGYGGFVQQKTSEAGKSYVHKFIAKLPSGYKLNIAHNSIGSGCSQKWLTSNEGTGKWQTYAYQINCGSTGTFSTFGHVYVTGGNSSSFTWYIAHSQITEVNSATYTYGAGKGILTAQWTPIRYNVRFHPNNGGSDNYVDQEFTYDVSQALRKNTFTKTGYTFQYWSKATTGSKVYDDNQSVVNLSSKDGDLINLYAIWSPNHYKLTLDPNNGILSDGSTVAKTMSPDLIYDSTNWNSLKNNMPSRTGYIFNGWYTARTGGTKIYNADGFCVNGSGYWINNTYKGLNDLTVYAQWTPKTTTVTFHRNTSSGDSTTAQIKFTYDVANQKFVDQGWTKTGYHALGWSRDKNATKAEYGLTETVSNNWINTYYPSIDLYEVWKANKYTVTYDGNGSDSGSMSADTATYDSGFTTKKNAFGKTGYLFNGWNEKADGTGTAWSLASYGVYESGKGPWIWKYTNNITLYAQWKPIEYDVKYDSNKPSNASNNVSGTMNNSHHIYDKSSLLNTNNYSLVGWTFTGWNTKADGSGTYYKDAQNVVNLTTKNGDTVILYAQWKVNTYTNSIAHWAWGFENGEGNNSNNKAYNINNTSFNQNFETSFVLDSSRAVIIPNGYYLASKFGTSSITGSWACYPFGTNVAQKPKNMSFEYDYYPLTYNISYDMNDTVGSTKAVNNSSNPTSYNVLYGKTIKDAIRTGYTFDGWYKNIIDFSGLSSEETTINSKDSITFNNGVSGNILNAGQIQIFHHGGSYIQTIISGNIKGQSVETNYTHTLASGNYDIRVKANGNKKDISIFISNVYLEQGKSYQAGFTLDELTNTKVSISNVHMYGDTKVTGINEGANATFSSANDLYDKLSTRTTGNFNLKAKWTANKYTIVYNSNKPSNASHNVKGSMSNVTHTFDEVKALTKNDYSLIGWTFTGWNTKPDGSGTFYKDVQSVVNLSNQNGSVVNLYAQWRQNVITIKYNSNSGINDNPYYYSNGKKYFKVNNNDILTCSTSKDGSYNTYVTEMKYEDSNLDPINVSTFGLKKTGYHTDSSTSWRIESINGTTIHEDNLTSTDMSNIKKYIESKDNTITLYTNWIANNYTIHFDGNKSTSGSMSDIVATYDKEITLPDNKYLRVGYKFIGWNTKADGSGKSYANKAQVLNLTTVNNGSITLYAQWKLNININIEVSNEIFHIGDNVDRTTIRRTLTALITDKDSGEDITNEFDSNVIDKINIIKIVDDGDNNYNLPNDNSTLNSSKENHYHIDYKLIISDTGITETSEVKQKVSIIKDIEEIDQKIPDKENPNPVNPDPNPGETVKDPFVPDNIDPSDGSDLNVSSDIRYISKKYLPSLNKNSKWRNNPDLLNELRTSLNKKATDENALYVIEITKEQSDEIKEWLFNDKTWNNDLNEELWNKYESEIIKKQPSE